MTAGVEIEGGLCVVLFAHERQRCEIWTRVMGYHRPEASFNIGKKGEYRERQCFTEAAASRHLNIGSQSC